MKKQSFFYGATVLAVASILCKMLSAAFKIPLDRFFLHEEGIAVYQSAYSVYNVFLAICVTGIPIALSSLIAGKDDSEASSFAASTFAVVTMFSALSAAILFVFAEPLAELLSGGGESVAALSLKVLCPALLVMGVISSRRGYFQGRENMTPSAISQLAESILKVGLGIGICALAVKDGIATGSAGALCGVTAGAMASALVLEIFYRSSHPVKGKVSFQKGIEVIKMSIPMTLGAFGFTAVMLCDTLTVPSLLAQNGIDTLERLKLFGHLTRANTVYNLPATIITAFTASAVPALAIAKSDTKLLSENAVKAVKLIFLAAFPCGLGMILFSREIISLLYSSASYSVLLAFAGVMVFIMPYVQTTTAMLQTVGKVWSPIAVSGCAALVKVILNFLLIKFLGVYGAPVATIIAFIPAMILNTRMLSGKVKLSGAGKGTLKLLFCAVTACGASRALYAITGGTIMLLVSLCIAVALYLCLIIVSGCISKKDFLR